MSPVEWKISSEPVPYPVALEAMERRVDDIIAGRAPELVWLLEHPALYTAGTSAKPSDLLAENFPVYATGRGGQYTYHGPGQRVVYLMLDLKKRNLMDMRAYVCRLEKWIIATLAQFGVESFTREGRVGVWTYDRSGKECKIAALGIRVRKWATFHGVCINVNPDLSHYAGIVPCGISEFGVTSLEKLGIDITLSDVDRMLQDAFASIFEPNMAADCSTRK